MKVITNLFIFSFSLKQMLIPSLHSNCMETILDCIHRMLYYILSTQPSRDKKISKKKKILKKIWKRRRKKTINSCSPLHVIIGTVSLSMQNQSFASFLPHPFSSTHFFRCDSLSIKTKLIIRPPSTIIISFLFFLFNSLQDGWAPMEAQASTLASTPAPTPAPLVVNVEYYKEIERAHRYLYAFISNKNCAPMMLLLLVTCSHTFTTLKWSNTWPCPPPAISHPCG